MDSSRKRTKEQTSATMRNNRPRIMDTDLSVSGDCSTTTKVNNSYLLKLNAIANETQSLIICAICLSIARYPVYAICLHHMFCFKCWADHALLKAVDKLEFDDKFADFKEIKVECPQCKLYAKGHYKGHFDGFVPAPVFRHLSQFTGFVLTANFAAPEKIQVKLEEEQDKETEEENAENESTVNGGNAVEIVDPCPFCKMNLAGDARKHLIHCLQSAIPCPNTKHGCAALVNMNDIGALEKHAREECKFFTCQSCTGQGYNLEKFQQHQKFTETRTVANNLNRFFSPREALLHDAISQLFSYPRFIHSAPEVVISFQSTLNRILAQVRLDAQAGRDTNGDYLQFSQARPTLTSHIVRRNQRIFGQAQVET